MQSVTFLLYISVDKLFCFRYRKWSKSFIPLCIRLYKMFLRSFFFVVVGWILKATSCLYGMLMLTITSTILLTKHEFSPNNNNHYAKLLSTVLFTILMLSYTQHWKQWQKKNLILIPFFYWLKYIRILPSHIFFLGLLDIFFLVHSCDFPLFKCLYRAHYNIFKH